MEALSNFYLNLVIVGTIFRRFMSNRTFSYKELIRMGFGIMRRRFLFLNVKYYLLSKS
jgi:hypothetical protein